MNVNKTMYVKRGLCGLLALLLILAAAPAKASGPLDLTDSLDWLTDVTLGGGDGAAFAEDTPLSAECLITYTFAVPDGASIHAGDTATIALPSEISTSRGESFQIPGDGGAQIAAGAYDGQNIIVTFTGDIISETAGTFSLRLNFDEENISGENPVNIVFPLSCGHTKTIGVNFAKAQAIAAMEIKPLSTISVENGDTLDLSTIGANDHIVVKEFAVATITDSNSAIAKHNKITCETAVELTIQNVNIDASGTENACPLTFVDYGILTLAGNNTLKAGKNQPGIKVQEQEYGKERLTINGEGTLKAIGGQEGAGIGGEKGCGCGIIHITDGTVTATGGGSAAGIGGGSDGGGGKITISDGVVDATGGDSGAGIGGGFGGAGGDITIEDGTVDATGGGSAAGIGGGSDGGGGKITINSGVVDATGGYKGAGIGGGFGGNGGTITIKGDAKVTAIGLDRAAGIGGGAFGAGGTITATGGLIYAAKGASAPHDIGDGDNNLGSVHSFAISGGAAVFLKNNACIQPTLETGYAHKTINDTKNPIIFVNNTVYGLQVPESWADTQGGYFLLCTLEYNANRGRGNVPDSVALVKDAPAVTVADQGDLSLRGCEFAGWNTEKGGGGKAYAPGDTFTLEADTTLFAQWIGDPQFMLAYDLNGGKGSTPASKIQDEDTQTSVDANTSTKEGYAFAGWNTEKDGGGKAYAPGDTFTFEADTTLFAQWAALYTLTYDSNMGGGSAPASKTQEKGTTASVAENTFTKGGYAFTGWNTLPGGGGRAYAPGDMFTFEADTTLFAQWQLAVQSVSVGITIYEGESYVLTATVTPGDTGAILNWTSSDEDIATVAGGKVTAAQAGTAVIKAEFAGKSGTCTVTVKARDPAPTPMSSFRT